MSSPESLAEEYPDRVLGCMTHVRSLLELSHMEGNAKLMDGAIELARKALALTAKNDVYRMDTCLLLSASLQRRYEYQPDPLFVEEAIKLGREAYALRPDGHPDRGRSCGNLVWSLSNRYEHTGEVHLLLETLDLWREALAVRPMGHPLRASACASLAGKLNIYYDRFGGSSLLMEAVELGREGLAPRSGSAQDRVLSCTNLARSLGMLYNHTNDQCLLAEVIDLEREGLSLRPPGHPHRFLSCQALANSLVTYYESNGDGDLLVEAIELSREALVLCPDSHPERVLCYTNLAKSLNTRYHSTGDEPFLTEAISLQRHALSLCPEGHLRRALCCGNLASSLNTLYRRTGQDHFLLEATELDREALALRPQGSPDRSMSCANLASCLIARYRRTGDHLLLEEAIDLERQALALRPEGNSERALSCVNLARSLSILHQRTGDERHLIEAIELEREALALRPKGHPDRPLSCVNLSRSLTTLYERSGNETLLIEAIKLDREALSLTPEGHLQHAASCSNLAISLNVRYRHTFEEGLLTEAIKLDRTALELRRTEDPDRVQSWSNLGRALTLLYVRTKEEHYLAEAIDLQQEVLSLTPKEHPDWAMYNGNLASSFRVQYTRTGDDRLLAEVLRLQEQALMTASKPMVWMNLCSMAWVYLQTSSSFHDVKKAILCLTRCFDHEADNISWAVPTFLYRLDEIWDQIERGEHFNLIVVYQHLVKLLPLLANSALKMQTQLQALKACSRIGSDAFVSAVLAESSQMGLETLELAHGVIWSQGLHYRDPQLQSVPEPLKSELRSALDAIAVRSTCADQLYDGRETALTPQDILHAHSSRAYSAIKEIRSTPGYERFMLGETYESLCTAASAHPVVVLVGARGFFYALIIAPSKTHGHALLSLDLTDEDTQDISPTYDSTRAQRSAAPPQDNFSEIDRAMKRIMPKRSDMPLGRQSKVLWLKVVKPVLDHLNLKPSRGRLRPRLHWCPTGIFNSLPLHAAGIYDASQIVCAADYVVSSYTPTVTALLRAQRASIPLRRDHLTLALVAEKRAQDPDLQLIPGVDEEISQIAAVVKQLPVKAVREQKGSTTIAGTSAAMQATDIVHLACHGVQDSIDATQSGFALGDGRLTISKLMELKLDDAFLAFLSACETAKGDKDQPDQVMHLAAAMLFSGYKSVVATMWAIGDEDGPKVAQWFYEELLSSEVIDVSCVPYALDMAVGKLRESGVAPPRWAPFIHMGA